MSETKSTSNNSTVARSVNFIRSVLWHCLFGDMKGLHPVTNLLYLYLYSHQQSPKVLTWKTLGGPSLTCKVISRNTGRLNKTAVVVQCQPCYVVSSPHKTLRLCNMRLGPSVFKNLKTKTTQRPSKNETKTTSLPLTTKTSCARGRNNMPHPLWLWPWKWCQESRVMWAIFVPILVFLGLSVLDLGLMYATDKRQTASSLNVPT